jgi:hypothetical protein
MLICPRLLVPQRLNRIQPRCAQLQTRGLFSPLTFVRGIVRCESEVSEHLFVRDPLTLVLIKPSFRVSDSLTLFFLLGFIIGPGVGDCACDGIDQGLEFVQLTSVARRIVCHKSI